LPNQKVPKSGQLIKKPGKITNNATHLFLAGLIFAFYDSKQNRLAGETSGLTG
jgi:hypothetical protein